jgi:pilus assembly protein CpaF
MSFELILPYFDPGLRALIQDPAISDVAVTRQNVFVDRLGRMEHVEGLIVDDLKLKYAIRNIARLLGDEFGEENPVLASRLPDGSRIAALWTTCSPDGVSLTIRKFGRRFTTEELIDAGALARDIRDFVVSAVDNFKNIVVVGKTSSGKTTLLNAFVRHIPLHERLIVIEKPIEIHVPHANVCHWEAVDDLEGRKGVSMSDLLAEALRHRPDRIIVGEVRGATAYDMLQAMNTGHSGTFSTLHANSASMALYRLASMARSGYGDLTLARQETAAAIDYVIHAGRDRQGVRRLMELLEVEDYDHASQTFVTRSLYRFAPEKEMVQ